MNMITQCISVVHKIKTAQIKTGLFFSPVIIFFHSVIFDYTLVIERQSATLYVIVMLVIK